MPKVQLCHWVFLRGSMQYHKHSYVSCGVSYSELGVSSWVELTPAFGVSAGAVSLASKLDVNRILWFVCLCKEDWYVSNLIQGFWQVL